MCIRDRFRDLQEYTLVFTAIGPKADELNAQGLPSHIIVRSFVPQLSLLKRASLFVSHVGMGSCMEALLNAVPLVAVPCHTDQLLNARIVESLKIGKKLSDTTVEGMRDTIIQVIKDEEIRSNVEKFSQQINPEESRAKFYEIVKANLKSL
eukprot:TRINITY_DN559_c0_g1_i1.p1 TRINITY_DN559_c0_g1~~TRINITY_DN559_c0_g1_i1.p1  ORF type:complete len:151 (+),score=20.61 TRINITY_DN559_c0_g1_i1:67-519(+)